MFHLVAAIAFRQHGVFTHTQAVEAGVDSGWLTRSVTSGVIERRAFGIYVLAGAPRTALQDLTVAVLARGVGALATADSGLSMWCPEIDLPRRPVVAVDRTNGRRQGPDCRLIRSTDLHLAKPGVVDGVPVVGVARALLDAAIDLDADAIVARAEACQRHLPMSFGALVEALHTHARRGRPGIRTFRRALGLLSREVPDSEFERLVLRDLVRAGAPEPVLHHVVRPAGEDPIELDIAWPDRRLDLELDGRDHFTRRKTARRDRQRDRILTRLGWGVLRFVWDDYLDDPTAMIDEILTIVDARHPHATLVV